MQICNADDSIQTFVVQDKINEPQLPYISCKQQTALMYAKKIKIITFGQYQASSAMTGREHITHVHVQVHAILVSGLIDVC